MRRLLITTMLLLGLAPAWCDNRLATLAGPALAKAAEGFVRQVAADPGVGIACDATIADELVPVGRVELRPHWPGAAPAVLAGRLTVAVAILVDGRPIREVGVPCRIQAAGAVRRGDPVTVLLSDKSGALRIEVPALARGDGMVGDRIQAEVLATHKVMAGHLSAQHQVVVP